MIKAVRNAFSRGLLLFLILIIMPVFLLSKVNEFISWSVASGIQISENTFLNKLIHLAFWLVIVLALGFVFHSRLLRKPIDFVMGKVPVLSTIAKFIPKADEMKALTDSDKKVIRFRREKGVYQLGIVRKEWKRKGVQWYRVFVPSTPTAVNGQSFDLRSDETEIEFTGETAQDFFGTVFTYGARSNEKQD